MIRMLIVLTIVALVFVLLNFRGGDGDRPPERPETTLQHQTENIDAMEQQLQQQARRQLEQIDAASKPQ